MKRPQRRRSPYLHMLHSPSQVDTYQSRSQKSDAAWPFHVSIDAMNETKLPDNNELELMLPTIDDPILHGAIAHDGCESSHSHSNDVGDEFHEAPRWNSRMSRLWTLFMLLMLYACQGSIVGLIGGTLPILLKPHLAYAEVGLFGLAFYPYSMKLLWSPIIDFYWFERLGRRKSWIVPTQLVAGCFMIALGLQTPQLFQRVKDHDLHALGKYVLACFCLIFLFASQGCAMDGWGLTLLPISSAHWVSTVKIVGMTLGSFVSYTLYILVNSSKFLQTTAPLKKVSEGESLGTLTTYLGLFNLVCGALILFFKSEEKDVSNTKSGLLRAYKIIFEILRIGCVRQIILVQLLAGLGFEANDAGTNLKLLDKGFGPKNIAIMTAISLPFDLASSVVAGTLCFRSTPMVVWNWSFNVRLAAAILAQLIVALYPLHGIPLWYSLLVYLAHVISVTSATTMAIALSTLHLQICDPSAGGTYMTLLHTYVLLRSSHLRSANLSLQSTESWYHDPQNSHSENDRLDREVKVCATAARSGIYPGGSYANDVQRTR